MESIKKIFKTVRRTIALIPLLLGALLYFIAEIIAGEKFTWRGDMVRRETMILNNREAAMKARLFNRNGMRQRSKKRR